MKYYDIFEHIRHNFQHCTSKLKYLAIKNPSVVRHLTFAYAPSLMFFVITPEEKSCN